MNSSEVLRSQVSNYLILATELKAQFANLDAETLSDTLEGISGLPEAIEAVVRSSLDDGALLEALKARLEDLEIRLERLKDRYAKKRSLARWAMQEAGLERLMAADFSVGLRKGTERLDVLEERDMTSDGKSKASRSKAAFGQGQKSAIGRARARRNALKSGLYAKTTLLPFEDAQAYSKLRVAIFSECGPQGAIEEGLVELIIADLWRLNRLVGIEEAFLEQTKVALTSRPAGPLPGDTLDSVRCVLGNQVVAGNRGSPAPNSLLQSADGNAAEIRRGGVAVLLDAFVCRISQTPMEDVARQRRCASRELLRNVAALGALQARRQAFNTTASAHDA